MAESYLALRRSFEAEKLATKRAWAKREKELDGFVTGVMYLLGDLEGIVGKSMPEVEALKTLEVEVEANGDSRPLPVLNPE